MDHASAKDLIVFKGSFDQMFSSKFCGSKLADYFSDLDNHVCVLLRSEAIQQTLSSYDQVFRRILNKFAQSSHSNSVLKVVVDSQVDAVKDCESFLSSLLEEIRSKVRKTS